MGWTSAIEIFDRVVEDVLDAKAPDDDKKKIIVNLFEILSDNDWDSFAHSDFYEHPLVKSAVKHYEEENMLPSSYDDEDER